MSTPKMYSSFIPNGHSEPHLHSPANQGLPLGDPELSLSQVGCLTARTHHRRCGFLNGSVRPSAATVDFSVMDCASCGEGLTCA